MSKRTIRVDAKCCDLCAIQLREDGKTVAETDGYVPAWLPSHAEEHYGVYISLVIDIDTGTIVNWKRPTKADLKATFKS